MPISLAAMFPPAPTTDREDLKARDPAKPEVKLDILAAACGVTECTDTVRSWVKDGKTLSFRGSAISGLAGDSSLFPWGGYQVLLAVVFQYSGGPMRMLGKYTTGVMAQRDVLTSSML